jgi:hypothetical protein
MSAKRTNDGDWDRREWKGEGQGPATGVEEREAPEEGKTWSKTEWVGDQGHGSPAPEDPDTMAEGESKLSGDRHSSGEQHWGRGQAKQDG